MEKTKETIETKDVAKVIEKVTKDSPKKTKTEEPKEVKEVKKTKKVAEPAEPKEVKAEKKVETVAEESKTPKEKVSTEKPKEPTETKNAINSLIKKKAMTFRNKQGTIRISEENHTRRLSPKNEAAAEILIAKTKNQPISVQITGVEPFTFKGHEIKAPVAYYKGWKFIIPPQEFFNIEKDFTEQERNDIISELSKRLASYTGTEVDVIPTKLVPDMSVILASRQSAMAIKKAEMWFAKNYTSDGSDFLLKDGTKVEARIMAVSKYRIFVEIFGVETPIYLKDLDYAMIDNARRKFKAGDKVNVILHEVKRNPETMEISYNASVKEAYPDPRVESFKRYVKNGEYLGTVAMIRHDLGDNAEARLWVRLDGISVSCPVPDRVVPQINDRVTVRITNKFEKGYTLTGWVTHVDHNEYAE